MKERFFNRSYFSQTALWVAFGMMLNLACGESPTAPSPNQQNVNVNVTINPGGGTNPSPVPGSGTQTKPNSVKISQFGETGPNPSGAQRTVRVGNVAHLTCSPLIGGQQAPDGSYPPAPDSFGLQRASSAVRVTPSGTTPYNIDVEGLESGNASFECIINGVSNVQTAGAFALNVVN